jgi:long-subunit acyl-CoA synthetase (AMP-forming)
MIALEKAQALIAAGISEAERQELKLAFAVVDAAGHLVASARMDGAPWIAPDVALGKAWTAAEKVGGPLAEQLQNERLRAIFQKEVESVNAGLARYEQIRVWELVPTEFTLEGGELTPTLKVKRRVINTKYKTILDHLYAAGDAGGSC